MSGQISSVTATGTRGHSARIVQQRFDPTWMSVGGKPQIGEQRRHRGSRRRSGAGVQLIEIGLVERIDASSQRSARHREVGPRRRQPRQAGTSSPASRNAVKPNRSRACAVAADGDGRAAMPSRAASAMPRARRHKRGEGMLRREPKSDRKRAPAGAAGLPSPCDGGSGSSPSNIRRRGKQQHRDGSLPGTIDHSPGTPSRSTVASATSAATGQIEPTSSRRRRRVPSNRTRLESAAPARHRSRSCRRPSATGSFGGATVPSARASAPSRPCATWRSRCPSW